MNDTKHEWTNYTQVNQLPIGEYLWRMPHRKFDVIVVFRAQVRMRGHGFGDNVASPEFDHWDGYRVHLPSGAQYREVQESDPDMTIEGIDLLPCPFCGEAPKWQEGNGYVTARANHVENFSLGHCIAEVRFAAPRRAAELWNRRPSL